MKQMDCLNWNNPVENYFVIMEIKRMSELQKSGILSFGARNNYTLPIEYYNINKHTKLQ